MVLKLLFMYTDRRRVTGRRTDRKMDRTWQWFSELFCSKLNMSECVGKKRVTMHINRQANAATRVKYKIKSWNLTIPCLWNNRIMYRIKLQNKILWETLLQKYSNTRHKHCRTSVPTQKCGEIQYLECYEYHSKIKLQI
jgi:hypothetical protein